MISLLHGTLRAKSSLTLIIEAGGVGYDVLVTQQAFDNSSSVGEECELWTRLVVREDSMTLYGFATPAERALFDQLVAVSGIGPKSAIAILSGIGETTLREAIRESDVHRLIAIPGIGRKTAERLIVELRDKLLKEEFSGDAHTLEASGSKIRNDALQALLALGYQRTAAEKAIRDVMRTTPEVAKKVETLIKAALQEAVKE